MLATMRLSVFAAEVVGVIAIAAVMWLEARRDARRQFFMKRLKTALGDESGGRVGEDQFKRAA